MSFLASYQVPASSMSLPIPEEGKPTVHCDPQPADMVGARKAGQQERCMASAHGQVEFPEQRSHSLQAARIAPDLEASGSQ
jgi:hypothetical protein